VVGDDNDRSRLRQVDPAFELYLSKKDMNEEPGEIRHSAISQSAHATRLRRLPF
jgi:hypothetical protein